LTRAESHQGPPPASLASFPECSHPGTLWRAARGSPWWYCNCGGCRFDLDAPQGTCYLGTDELVAILETIGPEIANGTVASVYLDARRLHRWRRSRPLKAADLADRRAVGSGVNNELSTMTSYTIPRAWARALHGAGFGAVSYRSRFDTSDTQRAVAHFGSAGQAGRRSDAGVAIGPDLRARLEQECGVTVAGPPSLDGLTVME
jgi:RES domain